MNMKALSICLVLILGVSIAGCPTDPAGDNGDNDPNVSDNSGGDPNDAQDPNDSVDPNDQTGPADPNDSAGPSDPNDSVGPSDPNDSVGPSDPNDSSGPDEPAAFGATGVFSGDLTRDASTWDSLSNATIDEQDTASISITFDENGVPEAFTIPAYLHDFEWTAEVADVGDSVTLNHTSGGYQATLVVTVAVVNYTATTGQVVFNLEHNGAEGALIEVGTGLHAIQFELDGDSLTYTAQTAYEIDWTAPLQVQTTQDFDCQGTLSLQP